MLEIEGTIEQIGRKTQVLAEDKQDSQEREQRAESQLKALEEEHRSLLKRVQQHKIQLGE